MQVLYIIGALLVYPGLLFVLLLDALYSLTNQGQPWRESLLQLVRLLRQPQPWNIERSISLVSIVLVACGLVLLPWPWNLADPQPALWLWSWAALEAAFLLTLLPGLLAGAPPVVWTANRAAQIGVAGRMLLWLALSVSVLLHDSWAAFDAAGHSPLLAHLLAALTAFFAFPAAVGWDTFSAANALVPGGLEQGLPRASGDLLRATRRLCTAALLAAALLALLPVALLPPPLGLLLVLVAFAGVALLLRRLTGRSPRLALPDALRVCLWRALPLGIAAVVYMGFITT